MDHKPCNELFFKNNILLYPQISLKKELEKIPLYRPIRKQSMMCRFVIDQKLLLSQSAQQLSLFGFC